MFKRPAISLEQAQAAMKAMLEKAMQPPATPLAFAIVDDAGILVAYAQMDDLRLFTRRHAIRKAYTAAITGRNSGDHGEWIKSRGLTVSDLGGDPDLTPAYGGVVVRPSNAQGDFHTNIMGGIGVGGYPNGKSDEEIALIGLRAMNV
jgi:uncharacterized protein GlcG (DUF336 family)